MRKPPMERAEALSLAKQLVRAGGDTGLTDLVKEVHARLKLPMEKVLDKVPGNNIAQKAARCLVSRQCYYDWLRGVYRPTGDQASRLARLTGYPKADIMGKGRPLKRPSRAKPKPRKRRLVPRVSADGIVV